MMRQLAGRLVREVHPRLLWKFIYDFGWKGIWTVRRFQRRVNNGVHFPAFLYLSITNGCNLQCQGCWVNVTGKRSMLEKDEIDRIIATSQRYGSNFFGVLGGEPLMHPQLMDILAAHRDCYFQLFTNGTLITEDVAMRLRELGNVTPLISIEGVEEKADERRRGEDVYKRTMEGLANCTKAGLVTGVASSICRSNIDDLLTEDWLKELIRRGVHYVWYYTYRPVGATPCVDLALSSEEVGRVRRFIVEMRRRQPIIVVDAYWDEHGRAICPMATGISHHINPYDLLTDSSFLADFRCTASETTRGCIILEHPRIVKQIVERQDGFDSTHRGNGWGFRALEEMQPVVSQHVPEAEIPEDHWFYRLAKRHWFFGFGAYG
jgi:uncharacterized Fe-S cluster-containing radical SAM superfamily protein